MDFIKMPADIIKNGCFQSFIAGVLFLSEFFLIFCNYSNYYHFRNRAPAVPGFKSETMYILFKKKRLWTDNLIIIRYYQLNPELSGSSLKK